MRGKADAMHEPPHPPALRPPIILDDDLRRQLAASFILEAAPAGCIVAFFMPLSTERAPSNVIQIAEARR